MLLCVVCYPSSQSSWNRVIFKMQQELVVFVAQGKLIDVNAVRQFSKHAAISLLRGHATVYVALCSDPIQQ